MEISIQHQSCEMCVTLSCMRQYDRHKICCITIVGEVHSKAYDVSYQDKQKWNYFFFNEAQ